MRQGRTGQESNRLPFICVVGEEVWVERAGLGRVDRASTVGRGGVGRGGAGENWPG